MLQWPYLFEFPGHVHGWAQADRLALAHGFLRNGFDLFHPETQVFNHIYPHDLSVQSTSTITAVDFPMHDIIAAFLMKLTGTDSPVIFRVYVLFMGLLGLVFLGKLARLILKDDIKALFVVVFASLSPVFVYYHGTLLPTIPSLSVVIAGLYYFFKYHESKREGYFLASIVLLGVAMLTRTTFVIPFIAIIAFELLNYMKTRNGSWKRLAVVVAVTGVFLIYRFYNQALTEEYGSMFLNRLMPPDNPEQATDLLMYVWKHLRFAYFSSIQYWAVFVIVCVVSYFQIGKRHEVTKTKHLITLLAIYLLGCVLFAVAMLKQFQYHDYYFLDTFYIPLILLLIFTLAYLPAPTTGTTRNICLVLVGVFVLAAFRMPQRSQRSRYEVKADDRLQQAIADYQDADVLLEQLHIPDDAIILVMDAMSPNTALLLMDRKGLVVMNMERGVLENAFNWQFDYVVFQVNYFEQNFRERYPEWALRLIPVGTNGRIAIFGMLK